MSFLFHVTAATEKLHRREPRREFREERSSSRSDLQDAAHLIASDPQCFFHQLAPTPVHVASPQRLVLGGRQIEVGLDWEQLLTTPVHAAAAETTHPVRNPLAEYYHGP